ncbi:hypothetical protein MKW92_052371 [Papaver armeniacum]|nr:hypothetical protein MKW92_052371 [Papaver armeniacum]
MYFAKNDDDGSVSSTPRLCEGCGSYESEFTRNLCSKCYTNNFRPSLITKECLLDQPVPVKKDPNFCIFKFGRVSATTDDNRVKKKIKTDVSPEDYSVDIYRCSNCKKRVRHLGFKCRCGNFYCSMHRLPETHGCTHDYKRMGREMVAKENPPVKKDKLLERI